jgi:type I site-specific restriction endonuclease
LKEKSGTWFRDLREPANLAKPLHDFHSPEGLLDKLARNQQEAEEKLKQEGFAYLKLRGYQEKAIRSVENALESEQSNCLLAMATGTGKTRTIIGLMYRFLKAERFKRILFLVDRSVLGQQAMDAFKEAPLEQNQSLSKIYNIAELGDMAAEAETRIQVATVQAMVRRIFQSDSPPLVKVSKLIRQYKNERYPSIAITVDLLTTGIDVPEICHLVFLRRVRSRILYEQMIGRGTRRCNEIGKTVFKIYDPVDIYAALQAVSSMKPLVKETHISIEQLVQELTDPKSFDAPGSQPDTSHADDVLDALNQKLMRVLRKATKKSEKSPSLKQKLDDLEQIWGIEPGKLHQHLL